MSPTVGDDGSGGEEASGGWDDKDAAVAKTAALAVFSGIAVSIIRALIAKPKVQPDRVADQQWQKPPPQRAQPMPRPLVRSQPPPQPSTMEMCSHRTVQIVRGDTLWGLSRRYGVSVSAIKEANGLQGDTIYAGRKLIIPSAD